MRQMEICMTPAGRKLRRHFSSACGSFFDIDQIDFRFMERVTGIEPASSAWEAEALPLDDTRKMLGFRRFYSQTVRRVTVGWQRNGVTSLAEIYVPFHSLH